MKDWWRRRSVRLSLTLWYCAIRSVGEIGLRGRRDELAYRSIIGSMLEEADRLTNLVDRLLALSRAETGHAMCRSMSSIWASWFIMS